MKSLSVLFLMLFTVLAHAEKIKIYAVDADYYDNARAEFVINADMDRAWVKVSKIHSLSDGDAYEDEENVKIAGLSYDSANDQLIFTKDGNKTICAEVEVRGRGIFRRSVLAFNGNCSLSKETAKRVYDDGYYTHNKTYYEIFLNVK